MLPLKLLEYPGDRELGFHTEGEYTFNDYRVVFVSDIRDLRIFWQRYNTFQTPCFKWVNTSFTSSLKCKFEEMPSQGLSKMLQLPRLKVFIVTCVEPLALQPEDIAGVFHSLCRDSGAFEIMVHFAGRPGERLAQFS